MHTSPLAQPGTGDGGGMNVYVRELGRALARSGVHCEIFTRAESLDTPSRVAEPGLVVREVRAGPPRRVAKETLPLLVEEWTEGVKSCLLDLELAGHEIVALHANYWLSGLAGHRLKHALDLPLVSTFHTLDRVKAEASPEELSAGEPARRAQAEAEIVGCSDVVLASCEVEADQLISLYGARPERIEIVPPGVDHAFFSPGDTAQARRALRLPTEGPLLLFVGRIQPLKGLGMAVEALARLATQPGRVGGARLVVVGGPSGPHGADELASVRRKIDRHGLAERVVFFEPVGHEALSTFYRAADACVVPSRSESFGLVALEAAACGVPVVAAAVGGLTSIVEDGVTGWLVDGHDPDALADRLGAVLRSPGMAAEMGHAATAAASRYTWADAASRLWSRARGLHELVACR